MVRKTLRLDSLSPSFNSLIIPRAELKDSPTAIDPRYDLGSTGDDEVISQLGELLASERQTTADVLCRIAEVRRQVEARDEGRCGVVTRHGAAA